MKSGRDRRCLINKGVSRGVGSVVGCEVVGVRDLFCFERAMSLEGVGSFRCHRTRANVGLRV